MMENTRKQSQIKVLQYMHGNFEYFAWSEAINRRYCHRHGYEYVLSRENPRTDRHVCWHKVPVMRHELHGCDYLLFVDADAHFYSQELTVEQELIPLMGEKDLLMAQDVVCERERWTPGKPNTGVIFMKNNDRVRNFLEAWDQAPEIDESTRWNWPPEQRALWNVVLPEYPECVAIHPDYYMIHGRYGHFIRHHASLADEERTEKMKQFYESRPWEEVMS